MIKEAENNKLLYIALLLVFVLGIGIRFFYINRPIRYDEAFTFLEYGRSPLGYVSMNYSYPNNHILHSILVRILTVALGDELWIIRLPALFGGILILILTFVVSRKWFGFKAGIITVSLVAFSEVLIGYSVKARGYSLQAVVFLTVLYLILDKNQKIGRWVVISALNAIGFWLIPSYVFCLGIIGFFYFYKHGLNKRFLLFTGLSFFFGFLLYLPVIGYLGTDSLLSNSNVKEFIPSDFSQDFSSNIITLYEHLIPGNGFVQIMILMLLILTSFQKQTKMISICVMLLISLLIALMGKHVPPRVFTFVIPFFTIVFAGALFKYLNVLKPKHFVLLLIVPLVSWSCFRDVKFDFEAALNDIPEVINDLKSKEKVGVISKIPVDYPVRYYLTQNTKLKSDWNNFGADTVYVIVNEEYQQDIKRTFRDKSKGYRFTKIKKYQYSTLYLGLKF